MPGLARERWLGFRVWLGMGLLGINPLTLRMTLGPIVALLPQAREVAASLHPWLLALLAERARLGLTPLAASYQQEEARNVLAADCQQQPCTPKETLRQPRWLIWRLEAELLRLLRLAEAPEGLMARREWLGWEVRYWALAVSLARVGQWYEALERRLGREAATETLKMALAWAWRQATHPTRAA